MAMCTSTTVFDPRLPDSGISACNEHLRIICKSHPKLRTLTEEVLEEFRVFRNHLLILRQKEKPPSSTDVLLSLVDAENVLCGTFPNLSLISSLILLCPLGTASVERSFSTMNRVLTRLRQRLSTSNMEACMLVAIEGPPKLSEDEARAIVQIWHGQKERRIRIPSSTCHLTTSSS